MRVRPERGSRVDYRNHGTENSAIKANFQNDEKTNVCHFCKKTSFNASNAQLYAKETESENGGGVQWFIIVLKTAQKANQNRNDRFLLVCINKLVAKYI